MALKGVLEAGEEHEHVDFCVYGVEEHPAVDDEVVADGFFVVVECVAKVDEGFLPGEAVEELRYIAK